MRFRPLLLTVALSVLAFPGVGIPDSHRMPSADGASVGFANLTDGAVVPPAFTVRFTISGMGIAPAGSRIENTGHHHLLVDVPELPDLEQPLPANDHILHFGGGQTSVELNLPEGEHTLQLILADYAHVPHDPPVMSEMISIRVSADAPPQDAAQKD
jgi:hypothetical protein